MFLHSQAGTYNVAGKKPPPGLKLHEWLNQWKECWPADGAKKSGSAAAAGPDIVVVGFQEIVPLSAGNVIAGPSSDGADAWDLALASTLNSDEWCEEYLCMLTVLILTGHTLLESTAA
jgi:phosphatidylinositol-bisphosphatase